MRHLFYLLIAILALGMGCCSKPDKEYIVKGSTSQSRLNGKKVYLVPYGGPNAPDSLGVDSTVIQDGKFEFRGQKGEFLARVTIDMKHRFGTQDLLIITEPGTINVVIDSVSSGKGTPQNDALQQWKELKEDRDRVHWNQSQHIKYLRETGDTIYANSLADSLKNFNQHYLDRVHAIMRMVGPGPAYDVLHQRYGDPE